MKSVGSIIIFFFSVLVMVNCQNQTQGEALYQTHCSNCHLADGNGLGNLIPSIAKSTFFEENPYAIACQIRNGAGLTIDNGEESYGMPPNKELSEIEITNILNYVRRKWHSKQPEFSFQEVKKTLESCNQ